MTVIQSRKTGGCQPESICESAVLDKEGVSENEEYA